MLLIDTPRKGIGSGKQDSATGQKVYDRIASILTAYGAKIQIIVADNDLPRSLDRRFRVIELDYENPLIADVAHPGPDAVETIGSDTESTRGKP
jgi:hypothetical protein